MWLLVVTLLFKTYDGGGPTVIQVQVDSKAKCEKLGAEIIKDVNKDFDETFSNVRIKESKYHCYSL